MTVDSAAPVNQEVAGIIAALVEGYQAEEASQGLGAGLKGTDEGAVDGTRPVGGDPALTRAET